MSAALERAAAVLRGMAYEHRLHILILLAEGERTPSALAEIMAVDATAIAHHLRLLRAAGLVRRERRGGRVFYTLPGAATARLVAEVLRYTDEAG